MVLATRLAYVPMTMVNGAVLGNLREPFCSELCYRGRCVDKVHHALGGRDDGLSPPEFLCLRLWTASGCSLAQGTSSGPYSSHYRRALIRLLDFCGNYVCMFSLNLNRVLQLCVLWHTSDPKGYIRESRYLQYSTRKFMLDSAALCCFAEI